MVELRIILAVIAPVLLAIIFYLLDTKTDFGKMKILTRQCVIGAAFGALACLATQFGIPYDHYVLNVRSAAPLTAGLVFGGPAGLIAGIIGALYRWFSVYWGISAYTRVACSVATLLAGVIATVCRKYMFGNKKTSWFYGVSITIATEVFHMLLVFLTHMDDIQTAFEVVKGTAVIMITANAISVFLSLLFVTLISKEKLHINKYTRPITQTFSIYLFICVFASFLVTSTFTSFLQKNISDLEVDNLLKKTVADVQDDIKLATDRDLLSRTESIKRAMETDPTFDNKKDKEAIRTVLENYLVTYQVTEINIVGPDGKIEVSSNRNFDGFDMSSGGQAEEFLFLLYSDSSYVQEYGPMDYTSNVSRKYAGISLSGNRFLQVGYGSEHFRNAIMSNIQNIAENRHIGQNGFVFILADEDKTLVCAPENSVTSKSIVKFIKELYDNSNATADKILSFETSEGETFLYAIAQSEGYTVVGCIPESEANFSRDISVYISAFMQLVVFFILFVVVFFLLKNIIVDNIHKINTSLAKITGGDLSTQVDIRENAEFTSLSNDINATVDRLKGFISEAEKRIDMELAFAKSIQHSVLPSVFPPYPHRTEFDIYATMHTAKEVGGDFYDFYLLGENQLVFLIADVSGKGIPAAMFMMNAKSVIKSLAESGLPAAEVFTEANERLCATNEAGMFVTAWMGILDLSTGTVKFANAGHNPPLIRQKDGTFAYFKTRPGLVLAGMEGIRYREGEFTLEPGDEIFLYTDGVTEATDKNVAMFGEDRLLDVLNAQVYPTAQDVCREVKVSIDSFVGEAAQFDDITMLSLKYNQKSE